ncbi:hypothetical protein CPB86DRAFT_691679, partial [Serendipita vermifera]
EFIPRFRQPFSLEMAKELDVQTLTTELVRLEDSVQRLMQTQETLKEFMEAEAKSNDASDTKPDEEILKAYEENVEVIGSQQERMQMIVIALEAKGVSRQSLSHYV